MTDCVSINLALENARIDANIVNERKVDRQRDKQTQSERVKYINRGKKTEKVV